DLEPSVLGHDREESGAADRPPRGLVDRGERLLRAGLSVREGRLDPALEAWVVLLAHDRPAPDRRVEGDLAKVVEVIAPQGLEPDAGPLQSDRSDPGLRRHPRMVAARDGVSGGGDGPRPPSAWSS